MTNRGEQKIKWPTEENRQYNDQQRRTDNRMNKYQLTLTVLTSMLSRYTLDNNNKYMLTLTVLTSMLSRYTLNNSNKYQLTLTVLTSMLSRYTLNYLRYIYII
jgi:GH18 family chitinase